jgi:hypothetical protein
LVGRLKYTKTLLQQQVTKVTKHSNPQPTLTGVGEYGL